jgi:glycosyltransferase involved in cell wall biosynthesis
MTPRGHNVLLIGPYPEPKGGVTIHIKRLYQALSTMGYACNVLDESPIVKPIFPNLKTITPTKYIRLLLQAEIVHVHTSNPIGKFAHAAFARLLGRRLVVTIHSFRGSAWEWALYRSACALSHRVIFVNPRLRERFGGKGAVIPAFIRPSRDEEGIPEAMLRWIEARRSEGRIIAVSNAFQLNRFDGADLYGLDNLIELFDDPVVRARFACVFVVSSLRGCESYFRKVQQRIRRDGIDTEFLFDAASINFSGLIKAGDVLIRATNTDGDSLSVREALWFGKPALASDCVDRPEGATLFKTRDVLDLKRKLLSCDGPIGTYRRMSDFLDAVTTLYTEISA